MLVSLFVDCETKSVDWLVVLKLTSNELDTPLVDVVIGDADEELGVDGNTCMP